MEIRAATLSDVVALQTLFHAYRQLSAGSSPHETEADAGRWIETRLKRDEAVFLIAAEGHQLLGFATLYPGFSSISLQQFWTLNDLYVVDQARGQGVGTALLATVEAHATATQAKGIALETSVENLSAQRLYESLGYQKNTHYQPYFKKIGVSRG
ncbi:GNAT family N-acetyltransferase (plasmid) [Photobacterium sp. GJ3]|uniref:GNAT family N-acetyltransferase n=1 Tax=Photobacterium sp. GJ3 TaxID=2829502 RepID=UPI001B8B89A4|nr:GNAT family N-acetyltransferase [Photobacterium sp. GJ3]QUJ69933.1 GNAT family N-acetyltransferase [Photobacterium sp. GJ3]